jgi:hypothetical protein
MTPAASRRAIFIEVILLVRSRTTVRVVAETLAVILAEILVTLRRILRAENIYVRETGGVGAVGAVGGAVRGAVGGAVGAKTAALHVTGGVVPLASHSFQLILLCEAAAGQRHSPKRKIARARVRTVLLNLRILGTSGPITHAINPIVHTELLHLGERPRVTRGTFIGDIPESIGDCTVV